MNKVIYGDCLEVMPTLLAKSVDMILCDLPYGTTACKWDSIIPFEPLWLQYKRLIKDNGAILLFGSEPFSSYLRMSNITNYKYDWYWKKTKANGFMNVKKMPLKDVETISVFYKDLCNYNPQGVMLCGKKIVNVIGKRENKKHLSGHNGGGIKTDTYIREYTNYPKQVIEFKIEPKPEHPTQKPVALFEYLIRTYTNEGETVLDNCAGSGTTAIACLNTNRKYILIEKEKEYIDIINKRISEHEIQVSIF